MKEEVSTVRDMLSRHLHDAGFFSVNFLDRASLAKTLEECKVPEATRVRYALHEAASAIIVALRYSDGNFDLPSWAGRSASGTVLDIGRFARANWYGELKARLKISVDATIAEARTAGIVLPPSGRWQRLVNSGIPEKALAEQSGAGRMGKNQIVIAESTLSGSSIRHSSAVVLGVLLCPVELDTEMTKRQGDLCGNCTRCIDACPTKALGSRDYPKYSRVDCIQHWTSTEGSMPESVEKAFGKRLYGCDACLAACPYFHVDPAASTTLGRIGIGLPAEYLIGTTDSQMAKDFAGTVLDRTWISKNAFRRNARLAMGDKNGR